MQRWFLWCALGFLIGCGGGGGGGSSPFLPPAQGNQSDFEAQIFRADYDTRYKNVCAAPRAGDAQGTTEDENDWLRAWSHDIYLWYDEIQDENPAAFTTPAYFDLMKTFQLSPTGAPKDQFHFTFDTEAWLQLSQSGISAGYGIEFEIFGSGSNREIYIAYVVDGSPAANAGLVRGQQLVSVDNVPANTASNTAGLNAGLFPGSTGEVHDFVFNDGTPGGAEQAVALTSAQITEDPVPITRVIDTSSGPVGYLHFTTHIATAEDRLVEEVQLLADADITELVLDLRYNGGGFLDIANQLAYMIAGGSAGGQVFDETQFNDKHPNVNPVTNQTLTPTTFHTTTVGIGSLPSGTPLPTLNLINNRVFVLVGDSTCSASEAIINGLRGIGFDVIMIGEPTCGKPYGFYPTDNCGTTYFSIQFRGINAMGFGDYSDGFRVSAAPSQQFELPGCAVADDFAAALGDDAEDRLATALGYIEFGDCSAAPVATAAATKQVGLRTPADRAELHNPNQMPGAVRRQLR